MGPRLAFQSVTGGKSHLQTFLLEGPEGNEEYSVPVKKLPSGLIYAATTVTFVLKDPPESNEKEKSTGINNDEPVVIL